MTCYKPLKAYRNELGEIKFTDDGKSHPMEVPCGQCIGCKLDYSRQWATRIVHEASLHNDNCFITLTYNPENLPPDCGLIKRDFKNFMKKLRKKYVPKNPYNKKLQKKEYEEFREKNGIRYFHCGEYGERDNRPHYHAIIFNFNFDDWTYLFDSPSGEEIYTSPTLEKIWGQGFVTIGKVTFESAAYCARYCVKKINGPMEEIIDDKTGLKHYERFNNFTGEIIEVQKEYATMSTVPAIAHNWIRNYKSDCYPKDFTTIRGKRTPNPRYYDKYLKSIDEVMYDDIKSARQLKMALLSDDNTEQRLSDREVVKKAQFNQLKRSL